MSIPVNHPNMVTANADLFLDYIYTYQGQRTLVHHHKEYYKWVRTHWVLIDIDEIEGEISRYFEHASYGMVEKDKVTGGERSVTKPFPVNNGTLDNLKRAIRNKTIIGYDDNRSNQWIGGRRPEDPDPADLIPMQNGILNVRTRELTQNTPRLFNKYALQFDYSPNPALPMSWLAFLASTFEGDVQRVELVQETLGYLCTPDLSQQKMFYLIGQPRAGKGTITRLINRLVGAENVGSTSLSALGGAHGLQSIAEKPVVTIGDAAASGRTPELSMERLLNIVGEDKVPVNPKGQKEYHATLPCRFVLSANDLPILPDSSGALRARIMILKFNMSFAANPDRNLGQRISAETAGIFVWALDGLDRLRKRGNFVQPEVGKEDLKIYEEITSPELLFVAECCKIGDGLKVAKDDLFRVWERWHFTGQIAMPKGGKSGMIKAIAKQFPMITSDVKMPRDADGRQANGYGGITLTDEARKRFGIDKADEVEKVSF
jgi:putative DNA primase/helicase